LIVIGLDVGEKRVGIAVTDPLGKTAQPLDTIDRDESTLNRLAEISKDTAAERLVVGLPLNMDGTEGDQADRVRRFAAEAEHALGIPLFFVDERLTTREAEAVLAEGKARRRDRKRASDKMAASIILRAYLDTLPEE
jgi:putative Holliday junction resolvase